MIDDDDVPAAHSMDTTWFAVDADGCVGVFESGEDGAVPNDAALGINPSDSTFDLFLLDAVTFARALAKDEHMLDGFVAREPPEPTRVVAVLLAVGPYRDHVGGKELAPIPEAFPSGEWFEAHRGRPRVLASMRAIEVDAWRRLAQRADVVTIITEYELTELLEDDGASCTYRFAFELDEAAEPGLYKLAHAPERDALKLEDLPAAIRDEIAKIKLPVRFAARESVHLADHFRDAECSTWGNTSLRGAALEPSSRTPASPRRRSRIILVLAGLVVVLTVLRILLGRR